jgi:hypothetical protein
MLSFDSPQEVSNGLGLAIAHSRGTPQRSCGQRVDWVDGWPVLHRRDARVVVQHLQHDRTYLAIRKEGVSGERGREDIRTNLLKDNSDPASRLLYQRGGDLRCGTSGSRREEPGREDRMPEQSSRTDALMY